jgi:hypothetical protein
MDRVAFSVDGKEFYYCFSDHWFNTADAKIKYFKYTDDRWQGPTVLNSNLYGPSFSNDGLAMFLLGKKGEVWRSGRTAKGWTPPSIYIKANYGLYDFMPTNSGIFYIASNYGRGKIGDWSSYDFSTLRISGKDTLVQSLGRPLNTEGFDGDFYIAPDESFMIISTRETKDFECELYISFHKTDRTWTNPKSLGALINDGTAHRWGEYVTPDKKYLFYTRGTSEKDCHIMWVRFDDLLHSLRQSDFAPYVRADLQDQSIRSGQPFTFRIPDTAFVDDDGNETLRYSARLESGEALPGWLKFNATTRVFSGMGPDAGVYRVGVTATDPSGAATSSTFSIMVKMGKREGKAGGQP